MKLNRLSKVALVATVAAGLVAGSVVPANAATRSTVVIVTSNALTSLIQAKSGPLAHQFPQSIYCFHT